MKQETEINFGSINRRQLCLRFHVPMTFTEWTGRKFMVAPLKFLNPRRWLRTIFSRYSWACHAKWHRHANHRCWCDVGDMFDGNIFIAGFSFVWFYSFYPGPIPCTCDEVIAEHFPELEDSAPA